MPLLFFFQKMQCFIVYMQGKLFFFLFRVFALRIYICIYIYAYIKMTKKRINENIMIKIAIAEVLV